MGVLFLIICDIFSWKDVSKTFFQISDLRELFVTHRMV